MSAVWFANNSTINSAYEAADELSHRSAFFSAKSATLLSSINQSFSSTVATSFLEALHATKLAAEFAA
jgi:hypothetical protein